MASIEELLTRVAVALEENTKRLDKVIGGGGKASAPDAGPAVDPGKAAARGNKGKDKASTPEITEAEVQERVGKYLKTGTAEEREAAKGHVRQIIEHYGAPKFTAIKPAQWPAALADLDTFAEGGTPEWAASGDEGGEDDNMI